MAEQCTNCGAELFVGQRFCRACGASTDDLQEQTPTRMMPPQQDDWGARSGAHTAPTYRPDTNPVYAPPAGYQPSVPPMPLQGVPPYTPPRTRSRLGWVLAFVGMGLFALIVFAVMMMARFGRNRFNDFDRAQAQQSARQGETSLSEANADLVNNTGTESALTKIFELDNDARFSIKNVNGNITITTWDQPKAEVKVIKRGSDRNTQVFFNDSGGNLSIRTASTRGGQEVRYEIKLPRELNRVELNSTNGSIRLADLTAEIVVEGVNGSIELGNVAGVSKVKTVNGSIKAVLREAGDHTMEFGNVNGNIDLTIKSDFNADLEASTARGSINIDEQLGIQVQREIVGQHARGEIGAGGPSLKVSTVNGAIKLGK